MASKEFFSLKEVYLRGIQKEDFTEGLFYWANDDEVTHYMVTGLKPSVKELMEKLYQDTVNNLSNGSEVVFTIVEKQSGKAIGLAGLYQINQQVRSAEFRILIGDKSFWGKGIGTECTNILVDYAFRNLNLNKVWLGVNEENLGAVKSYEKAGFIKEGKLRQEIYRNNKYYDAIRMSILRSEWEKILRDQQH
ncbi:MAG: GNAT family protein [Nanoarchaeota archaeon]